jgi:hypothetical protein
MLNVAQKLPDDDLAYWKQRAEEELEFAAKAGHPNAIKAHHMLADYYLERVNRLLLGKKPVMLVR